MKPHIKPCAFLTNTRDGSGDRLPCRWVAAGGSMRYYDRLPSDALRGLRRSVEVCARVRVAKEIAANCGYDMQKVPA